MTPRTAADRRAIGRATAAASACGALALGTLPLVTPAPLAAQSAAGGGRFDAEVGAAVVRQPGVDPLAAPTLGGAWAWDGARTAVRADGAIAADARTWSGQFVASAARFVDAWDAPYELGLQLRAAHAPAARGTTQLLGGARRHLMFGGPLLPTGGVWVGGLGGVTTGVGAGGPVGVVGAEAGGWRTLAGATRVVLTAAWTATRVDSTALATAATGLGSDSIGTGATETGNVPVHTIEATATVVHVGARIEVTGSAGGRRTAVSAGGGDRAGARWGALLIGTVTWWVRPDVGLVAGAGAQPGDPARGLPPVRHVGLALRLRPRARPRLAAETRGGPTAGNPTTARRDGAGAATDAPIHARVTVHESRVLHVSAPGAVRVQVRAAATGWRPVDLTRDASGEWVLPLTWPPGAHRLAVRIDEGPWRAPANLPAVDDDYGGHTALLVVP